MISAVEEVQQAPRLGCMELRGGNERSMFSTELPGLACWVSCNPLRPSESGGDLYFLSSCSDRVIARLVLADVSGHGEIVSAAANDLRRILRLHIDNWDQPVLAQELNDSFLQYQRRLRYATALLLSFASASGELVLTNAGHLPPLHYLSATTAWQFLREAPEESGEIADLPLGLMVGTPYRQSSVRLEPGDLVVLYTDGINEAQNESGKELGLDGLQSIVQGLPAHSATIAGTELLERVGRFRGSAPAEDDATVIVLMPVEGNESI